MRLAVCWTVLAFAGFASWGSADEPRQFPAPETASPLKPSWSISTAKNLTAPQIAAKKASPAEPKQESAGFASIIGLGSKRTSPKPAAVRPPVDNAIRLTGHQVKAKAADDDGLMMPPIGRALAPEIRRSIINVQ